MIMTMALVTTFRALLSELGWAMHVASMVEVELDPEDDEPHDDPDERGDGASLLQVEAVSLVQHHSRESMECCRLCRRSWRGPHRALPGSGPSTYENGFDNFVPMLGLEMGVHMKAFWRVMNKCRRGLGIGL